jgi:hypothetical protein
MVVEV